MTRIEVPNLSPPRRASGRILQTLILVLLLVAAGSAGWTWLTLAWAYSDGERAGVLQKFSRKGWLCKTEEGELAQYIVTSMAPQIWEFSVRDEAAAAQLRKAVGHRVQLHYTEHPGVPTSCFGETRYFVDQLEITDNATGLSPGLTSAPAASAPPAIPSAAPAPVPSGVPAPAPARIN
jgi:hypothetical protein